MFKHVLSVVDREVSGSNPSVAFNYFVQGGSTLITFICSLALRVMLYPGVSHFICANTDVCGNCSLSVVSFTERHFNTSQLSNNEHIFRIS